MGQGAREERTREDGSIVDKSVENLSSIVMLVEAGKKSMLTGDARGDDVLTVWASDIAGKKPLDSTS